MGVWVKNEWCAAFSFDFPFYLVRVERNLEALLAFSSAFLQTGLGQVDYTE